MLENSRGRPSILGEVDGELLAAIERALELDDGSDQARRARLLAIHALELSYDPSAVGRRRAIVDEAIALARDADDPAALACVLRDAWRPIWSADTLPQLEQISEELIDAAARAHDPALSWWAKQHEYLTSLLSGRLERAATALSECEQAADGLQQPALRWHVAAERATWEQLHGRLTASMQHAERALAIGQDAVPLHAANYYGANLCVVRVHQGRGEEVIETLEGSVAAYPGIPAWRAGLAVAYCRIGAFEKATAIVEDAGRDRFEHIAWDPVRMSALALYADAAAYTGSVAAAKRLYELLEPWADQVVCNEGAGYGHGRMYLGELAHTIGRNEFAIEQLEFAVGFHEEHGLLLWAAESHLWLGRALLRRGDARAAREHARRALELARANGYRPLEPLAAELLSDDETDHRLSTSVVGS